MEKITRHNYEAFFLDYLEGNLSEAQKAELSVFLKEHPDLAEEIDDFELVSLKPEPAERSWGSLKVPDLEELRGSESLREQLYFRCAEGDANSYDQNLLAELRKTDRFQKEYLVWERLRLTTLGETTDREGLYRLPLILPVNAENYQDFLVARTEGILSVKENAALNTYAASQKNGASDLALADVMRLDAPRGIFYPYKSELKKRKRSLVFLYRAAAVILLFGMGATLFTLLNRDETIETKFAQREQAVVSSDTLTSEDSEEKSATDSLPDKIDSQPYQLHEWEIREPDPVFVAEQTKPQVEKEQPQERHEVVEDLNEIQFAEVEPVKTDLEVANEREALTVQTEEVGVEVAEEIPVKMDEFQTLGELAENRLANELDMSDEERDAIAMTIAKRIAEKAGETLDSEVSRKVNEESETLTYTLRIGGFKVSHTKAK